MKKTQFKGYILEELLAYLIKDSGYSLIQKPQNNDPDLEISHNGLNLKGRGAKHQIDVLGELKWIPAFNFPLRLIVEAKFRDEKIGINIIREQVGILNDVNQNYFVIKNSEPTPRYQYNSVVFSTSGFSVPAIDMAIAHQIQLVDLNDNQYDNLKTSINNFANNIFNNSDGINADIFKDIKTGLRDKLYRGNDININRDYVNDIDTLIREIQNDKLFIGMSQGGFMLLLKADDSDRFIFYAKEKPTHNITIHWNNVDNGKKWTIQALDDSDAYKLTFNLPDKLHDWIFKTSQDKYSEALNQKERHFSKISVYYHKDDRDWIFNLKFDRSNLDQQHE